MPLKICCHSYEFQGFVHVVGSMQVSVYQACIIVDQSKQLMSPSLQAIFL